MTAAEQKRFERLATAIRRICNYRTPLQLRRESERSYGLGYEEALEYAYENMRNEAMAVRSLVRPKKRKPAADPASSSASHLPAQEQG